jgi:hypothetical protein
MVIQTLILGYLSLTAQATEHFDQARAWNWLTKQCDLGPRTPGSAAHIKCRDMILEQAKKTCDRAELQPFRHEWSKTKQFVEMWNVVAFHNWEKAKVRVVLAAHWDTRPSADQEYDSKRAAKPILGANDGASGAAVLLELMQLNKTLPEDIGICYAFFDGEDLGPGLDEMFLGAVYYSGHLKAPKPDYGILLDMIGDRDLKVPVEPNSYKRAQKVTVALYRHAKKVGLEKTFPMEYGPEILDDHLSMNSSGIPTVDLIDFDYEPWHTLDDTVDKCSAESLGKVGKLLETWCRVTPVWSPK